MKPLKLFFSAFGPYAGEQSLDFADLRGHSFFLIHGNTGTGKTTILDAICYALYGDTSGKERSADDMRCQLAALATPTVVRLDFSLGEKIYRIERLPQQIRPRKKGEGTTLDDPKATLWERTLCTDDAQEGVVLAGLPTTVTNRMVELLGFKSEQFRQVIMLPQGKFRDLLIAESRQREAILETLFGTEYYSRIESALKLAAADLRTRFEQARDRRAYLLRQADVGDADALAARRTELDQQRLAADQSLVPLRAAETLAQLRLQQATTIQQKLQEFAAAQKAVNELSAARPAMDALKQQIDRARRAANLSADERLLAHQHDDQKRKLADHHTAAAHHKSAALAHQQALATLAQAQQQRGELDRLHHELALLKSLQPRVEKIASLEAQLKSATTQHQDLIREQAALEKRWASAGEQLQRDQKALAELREQSAAASSLTIVEAEAKRLQNLRGEHEQLRTTFRKQSEACRKLGGEVVELTASTEAARQEFHAMQERFLSHQAQVLARQLTDNQPCPVCGSREHPHPATGGDDAPSQELLREKQEAHQMSQKLLDEARRKLDQLTDKRDWIAQQGEQLKQSLGEAAELSVQQLQQRWEEAAGRLKQAQAATQKLPAMQEAIGRQESQLQQLGQQRQQWIERIATAAGTLNSTRGMLDGTLEGIDPAHRTPAALEQAITRAQASVGLIETRITAAQQACADCEKAADRTVAAQQASLEALNQSQQQVKQLQDQFAARLIEQGFSSQADFAAARLSDVQIRGHEQTLEKYAGEVKSAEDQLHRTGQLAHGLAMPDLSQLQTDHSQAQAALEAAIKRESELTQQIKAVDGWIGQLAESAAELASIEAEFSVSGRLAEVASGRNTAGLTLQRFVLTFLLDDVLLAATQRLKIMSRGRYQLHRVRGRDDQRKSAGLELEVIDSHSGQNRSVQTLSGGESFLASLSLALGLADVVQTRAGGRRLETMFIDEGFGSLDSQSLDLAINALTDLLRDDRLVGIISHVPELRERIPARLEVVGSRGGSSAKFIVSG